MNYVSAPNAKFYRGTPSNQSNMECKDIKDIFYNTNHIKFDKSLSPKIKSNMENFNFKGMKMKIKNFDRPK